MWKELNNKTKILLVAIITATVLVIGGITYAYFSASEVSGNVDNNIEIITTENTNIIIEYYNGNKNLTMNNIDLKESEKNTTQKSMVKFIITKIL